MKTTALHEIPEMEDKLPVLSVEGTVKVALDVKHGETNDKPWSRQFFVLAQGNDEIGCTMWDAEGNAMVQGEHVRIEATQNKKKQWTGMTKGSYEKGGETKHTLEIRANNVKIINLDENVKPETVFNSGTDAEDRIPRDPDWPEAPLNEPEGSVQRPKGDDGVLEARIHLMKAANLYNLCVDCVNASVAGHLPAVAQTPEMFQAAVGTLFIESSRAGYVSKMPAVPIKK